MEESNINPTSFRVAISVMGKLELQYSDTDKERFDRNAERIVADFMSRHSAQNGGREVKNFSINYQTY